VFSQLGPLFKTMFRSAEAADARLEIRREEKESGRKREGEEDSVSDDNTLWEDSTGVSVTALRAFLIDFLRHQGGGDFIQSQQSVLLGMEAIEEITIPAPVTPTSTIAARAAKAYGAMASQNAPTQIPQASPPQFKTGDENLADLLQSDEVRQIHHLITELDIVARTGIESLTIELNGGTFLDAVANAIRIARGHV
jgi:hypothetical protein